MEFSDYTRRIQALGRPITMDLVTKTRELLAPLHELPPYTGVNIERDVSYGEHERQRLDIFTSDEGDPERPLLVFVHGGGFVGGDKYTPGTPFYDNIGVWAVANGFNAVNMTYRLAPDYQWPSGAEDIHRALQWLKQNAERHGAGARKIFLMGQSAGAAHAAGFLAHPEVYPPQIHGLAGLILISGLYDFVSLPVSDMEQAYYGNDEARYAERSSLNAVASATVPLLIALAEFEPPNFEKQTLKLLTACQQQQDKLPRFVHMIGQNHLSGILYLGLEGDVLGPQLKYFIEEQARDSISTKAR